MTRDSADDRRLTGHPLGGGRGRGARRGADPVRATLAVNRGQLRRAGILLRTRGGGRDALLCLTGTGPGDLTLLMADASDAWFLLAGGMAAPLDAFGLRGAALDAVA